MMEALRSKARMWIKINKAVPRILHIIDSFAVGGAEVLLKNTLPLLDGYEHVVCYLGGKEDLKPAFAQYKTISLGHTSNRHILRSARRLRRIIRLEKVDLVHAHLFQSTLVARLATPRSVPLIFTLHNLLSKDAFEVNRLSVWAEKLTYKKRHVIIGVSREAIADYDKWIGVKGESHVLYNGIEEKFFSAEYHPRMDLAGQFRLVAVGALRRQKNYETLLEAFRLLKDIPVSLDIYGSGDLKDALQERIDADQLNVSLKGRVLNIERVLAGYDAYIMPSLFEGYGIAPMEAMATGLPVLLSDIPVFREVAGNFPVFFDPTSAVSIAERIRFARDHWQEFLQQSAGNREWVRQRASASVYRENLVRIYEQYIHQK